MKSKLLFLLASGLGYVASGADNPEVIVLYQVGQNGRYCVSLTPDSSSCVSGIDENGNRYNTLDITQGKQVVFRNVSDAPHDMVVTGVNKENIPAQAPNGDDAVKKMQIEDPNKEKITCSFHGDMLSVGYRVPKRMNEEEPREGHKENPDAERVVTNTDFSPTESNRKNIMRTPMADVSNEVLKKGRPEEVARLVAARPELMETLSQVRPLLAKEVSKMTPTQLPSALGQFPQPVGTEKNSTPGRAAVALAKGSNGPTAASQVATGESEIKVRTLDEAYEAYETFSSEEETNSQVSEMSRDKSHRAGERPTLGAASRSATSERTRMKTVRELASHSRNHSSQGQGASSAFFPWLLLGLTVALGATARFVISGTKRQGNEKERA